MKTSREVLRNNTVKIPGTEAVERLISSRGYVVVAFLPGEKMPPSESVDNFAGAPLPAGKRLRIKSAVTFEDWQSQIEILGLENPTSTEHVRKCHFFKAVLTPAAESGCTQRIERLENTLGTLIQWLYGTRLNEQQMKALHEMLNAEVRL